MSGINEMMTKVHNLALEAGWWIDHEENKPNLPVEAVLSKHMLFVTEVSEATEEVREKKPPYYWVHPETKQMIIPVSEDYPHLKFEASFGTPDQLMKPEGELAELADVIIRVMDYCGFRGWDLEAAIEAKHNFNKTRAFRHGGKAI